MSLLFLDTSALIRAYFDDEPEHEQIHSTLFLEAESLATSSLTLVEADAALESARRSSRISRRQQSRIRSILQRDFGPDGDITTVDFRPAVTFKRARELIRESPLAAADAIHLAVADIEGRRLAGDDELIFVTRDSRQARAAKAIGFKTA